MLLQTSHVSLDVKQIIFRFFVELCYGFPHLLIQIILQLLHSVRLLNHKWFSVLFQNAELLLFFHELILLILMKLIHPFFHQSQLHLDLRNHFRYREQLVPTPDQLHHTLLTSSAFRRFVKIDHFVLLMTWALVISFIGLEIATQVKVLIIVGHIWIVDHVCILGGRDDLMAEVKITVDVRSQKVRLGHGIGLIFHSWEALLDWLRDVKLFQVWCRPRRFQHLCSLGSQFDHRLLLKRMMLQPDNRVRLRCLLLIQNIHQTFSPILFKRLQPVLALIEVLLSWNMRCSQFPLGASQIRNTFSVQESRWSFLVNWEIRM